MGEQVSISQDVNVLTKSGVGTQWTLKHLQSLFCIGVPEREVSWPCAVWDSHFLLFASPVTIMMLP